MTANDIEIKVGQHWQVVGYDVYPYQVKEIVEISAPYRLQCSGNRVVDARDVTLRSVVGGRTTGARTHATSTARSRFSGKRGGYKLVKDVE